MKIFSVICWFCAKSGCAAVARLSSRGENYTVARRADPKKVITHEKRRIRERGRPARPRIAQAPSCIAPHAAGSAGVPPVPGSPKRHPASPRRMQATPWPL
jgi:hypothetical protein